LTTTMTEHVDVLIVGAGLSGIGAAHHLLVLRYGRINDGAMRFTRRRRSATAAPETTETTVTTQTPAAS
jgi:glycine/D-amino acid oxidase-like deaminating enzyme